MLHTHDRLSDVAELAGRFIACTLPREEWTHQAHLAVGLWHICEYGAAEALPRLRAGIRRLNEIHGTANTPTGGYHETITRAYVQLLSAFSAACPAGLPLSERVARLLEGGLADRNILFRFYSRQLLLSPHARAQWVEPDIMPVGLSGVEG